MAVPAERTLFPVFPFLKKKCFLLRVWAGSWYFQEYADCQDSVSSPSLASAVFIYSSPLFPLAKELAPACEINGN